MGFSLAIYGIILYYSIVGGGFAHLDKLKKVYKQKKGNVKMSQIQSKSLLARRDGRKDMNMFMVWTRTNRKLQTQP